jgi:hypothetical protein
MFYNVELISNLFRSYTEWRTRRDHVEHRNKAFELQMPLIKQAYLEWEFNLGDTGLEGASPRFKSPSQAKEGIRLRVMDVFCEWLTSLFSVY